MQPRVKRGAVYEATDTLGNVVNDPLQTHYIRLGLVVRGGYARARKLCTLAAVDISTRPAQIGPSQLNG